MKDVKLRIIDSKQEIMFKNVIEWTGRTDTNGKDIYDGDKVIVNGQVGFIQWERDGWRVVSKDFGIESLKPLGSINGKDIKVTGSIYGSEDENVSDEE